jgi:uncharacterized cupin superfamily protein
MPRIDLSTVASQRGADYPPPFDAPVAARDVRNVSAAGGLSDVVANHVVLPPGAASSQRHWHEGEDEVVVIVAGEATLVEETGRTPMRAGDVAVFRKGEPNGHMLVNEGEAPCVMFAIGRPQASPVHYSDVDLVWTPDGGHRHRDGMPY